MGDDPGKRGPADRDRINVHERWELQYWAKELGVDTTTLKATVNRVGPMVAQVRQALRGERS